MQTEYQLTFDRYRLDLASEQLWRDSEEIPLPGKVFALLRYMVEHAGQLVSKAEFFAALWPGTTVTDGTLTFCIVETRKALEDNAKTPRFIETVHRRGYRFIAKVDRSQYSVVSREEERQKSKGKSQKAKVAETQSSALSPQSWSSPTPDTQPPAPILVGRDAELTQLHSWLAKALNGERQIVFVTGEPGIGKTTLVDAFLQSLASRVQSLESEKHGKSTRLQTLDPRRQTRDGRWWVAVGQSIEHYGPGEPYMPILEALGRLCRAPGGEPLVTLLQHHAPTWLAQMPSLLNVTELEALQRKTTGATRERMLRELGEALDAITAERPLVLWLEDLHWSDASTVELLSLLARRRETARLLVIATYRPVDVIIQEHPLSSMKQELQLHGLCAELPLGLLSERQVAEYLAVTFDADKEARHGVSFQGLARLIHRRTDGNPLFLVSTVDELVAQGRLTKYEGSWTWQGEVADVGIAESIRHLVARQSGRLSLEERHTLEAASVAGMEFSAVAVAAALATETIAIERHCEQLAERQQFLRRVGVEAWPDGTLAARYSFLHAVYQQLWHERVSPTQLQHYHRYIGECKERAYGDRAREIAAELALHFEQGRDYPRAVQYLQLAGENAVRRSANQEAIALFTRERELLQALPDMPERTRHELRLHLALGAPLLVMRGYTAPEIEVTYSRALALCRQGSEPAQRFQALAGLWQFYTTRAEHQTARELAEQLLALAQSTHEPALLLGAHDTLGQTLFMLAELTRARGHLEQSLALYDPAHHHSLATLLGGEDPGVACRGYTAWTLWLLGYPAQARQRMREALTLAQDLHSPFNVAFALFQAAHLHLMRREGPAAHGQVEALMRLIAEQGFPYWLAGGTIMRGWALDERGQGKEGIAQIRQGLTDYRATGVELFRPYYLILLAEAYERVGQEEEGLSTLAEALATVNKTGERVYEAELYRLKGELTLQQESKEQRAGRTEQKSEKSNPQAQSPDPQRQAEACFRKAIEISQKQQAKSLELRATMSLVRLRQQQVAQPATRTTHHITRHSLAEAHQMLSEVYHWFTEGFDTKDLQEAKAMLEACA